MENIQKIAALWWARILLFIGLTIAVSFVLLRIFPQGEAYLPVFITVLGASFFIESIRKNSTGDTLGMQADRWAARHIMLGAAIAAISVGAILGVAYISGAPFDSSTLNTSSAFWYFTFITLLSSITEELIFRGIIFQALLQKFSAIAVVIVLSLLFAAGHTTNPNFSVMAMINIFLANILLSVMYLKTKSLWLPISFHFFWNWGQQLLLGSPVSGFDFEVSIININFEAIAAHYPFVNLLLGGGFGIEEGLMTSLLLIISTLFVAKYAGYSPFLAARIFERNYAESLLMDNHPGRIGEEV